MDNKKEEREIKKAIEELPKPSFNNPEKVQPAVTQKVVVPSSIETPNKIINELKQEKVTDKTIILTDKAPKIERVANIKNKNPKVLRRFFKLAKPFMGYLIFAIIFAFINSIFEVLIPILIGKGVDQIIEIGNVNFEKLGIIIMWLSVCIVGFAIFKWLTSKMANTLSYKIEERLHIDIFKKFNKVALKTIDNSSHGDLQSRMVNDVDNITDGFVLGLTTFFDCLASIVLTLIFMFRINITISIVIVCVTPLSILVATIIAKKSDKLFKKQAKALGDLSGQLTEMVGNQKIVKAFQYEDRSVNKFNKINQNLRGYNEQAVFYASLTNPLARFINGILYAIVAIMGTLFAINGQMSIGSISTMLSYANKYTKPFDEITGVFSDIQSAIASAVRVFNVLDIENEVSDENNLILDKCDGTVVFKDVNFSYTQDKKLIQNLNLSVEKGQKVAIVGPTGCGKSTLINLLMRFYDVNSGEILVSGHNVKDLTRDSLRKQFGMVLQETWLFSASIKDNIAYGSKDAKLEDIIKASKKAGAHYFIETLENGYDTIITENGDNLSQGQKQLICIARLMLTKPPMLILDEATSNIDTRTELQIQEAFNSIMKNKTTFVVAHRLSTIISSDIILVMNKGNIIEQGTHKELLNKKGFYYNLYNSQFSNY